MKQSNLKGILKIFSVLFVIFYAVFYFILGTASGMFGGEIIIISSLIVGFMAAFIVLNIYSHISSCKNGGKK